MKTIETLLKNLKKRWYTFKNNWRWKYSYSLKRKWDKICSYSPIVLRRTLNKEKQYLHQLRQDQLKEKDKENQKEKEALNKLIKGLELIKVNIEYAGKGDYLGGRYRVAIDINPRFVEHTFVHGDDQYAIDIMCRELTYEIGTELRRINFRRECYEAQRKDYEKRTRPLEARRFVIDESGNRKEI